MTLSFPPHYAFGLLGGLMIGAAAALLLLGNGRILGASGIAGRLLEPGGTDDWLDQAAFVVALVLAPGLAVLAFGRPAFEPAAGLGTLALAGLAVGLGTRMANGCTSGHGVVGLARRSPRSMLATATFLAAGFATFHLARHYLGVI